MEPITQLSLFPELDGVITQLSLFPELDGVITSTNQIDKQKEVTILNWWEAEEDDDS